MQPIPSNLNPVTIQSPLAPRSIFKAYDIRGIVGKTLTPKIVESIGHALGSEARQRGDRKSVV